MQNDLGKKIVNASKWSSITEIIARLISPVVNIFLARLLAPEEFGIVATITMVITFAEIFTDGGFQKYLIQHEFKDENELDKNTNVAFLTNLGLSLVICALIFFFRDVIAANVGSPGLGDSISISSVLIIIAAFSSIQMARFKRAFDFKTLFYARAGASLIPLLVTIPLAIVMRNYWALLIGNFASQLFTAVILTIKSKWKPSLYFSFGILKEMFSFSAWTLLESISIWLTSNIGIFIVGNTLNEYYLGIYKTSMSTVNSYMAIITAALTPVLFSALSRYQNDNEGFKKTYYGFQKLTATLIFPMGVGIFLYRDLVTAILLGEQWKEAAGFVGLWGLTSSFTIVFSHFSSEVYRSKGKPKISLFAQLLHLAFVIPALIICTNYSFTTLYTVRSLVRIQSIITAIIIMRAIFKFRIIDVFKNVFPMIASSVIMGACGYALQMVSQNIVWQIISVMICAIIYFAVLLVCFPSTRRELLKNPQVSKYLKRFQK